MGQKLPATTAAGVGAGASSRGQPLLAADQTPWYGALGERSGQDIVTSSTSAPSRVHLLASSKMAAAEVPAQKKAGEFEVTKTVTTVTVSKVKMQSADMHESQELKQQILDADASTLSVPPAATSTSSAPHDLQSTTTVTRSSSSTRSTSTTTTGAVEDSNASAVPPWAFDPSHEVHMAGSQALVGSRRAARDVVHFVRPDQAPTSSGRLRHGSSEQVEEEPGIKPLSRRAVALGFAAFALGSSIVPALALGRFVLALWSTSGTYAPLGGGDEEDGSPKASQELVARRRPKISHI